MRTPATIFTLALMALAIVGGFFLAGFLLMRPAVEPQGAPSPVPESQPGTATAPYMGPRLVIRRAEYGDLAAGSLADVTEKVKEKVADQSLAIVASNDNFGDSAPGIVKTLRVEFLLDGIPRARSVTEGETLKISPPATPSKLIIKKAVYGDLPDGAALDVTEKVAAAFDSDSLSIAATNDNFTDPAPGIVKKLRVDYNINGKPLTKTVNEGESLTISSTGE